MINQSQLTPQVQVDAVSPVHNATLDNPTGDRIAYINDYEISAAKTYSSYKIRQLIDAVEGLKIVVVDELPESGATATIYLTPNSSTGGTNTFDEWLWVITDSVLSQVDGGSGTRVVNTYKWEKIGSTQVDLTNYYTKTETDTALAAKANQSNTYTKLEVATMVGNCLGHSIMTQDEYDELSAEEKADTGKIRVIQTTGGTTTNGYIGNLVLTTGSTGGVTAADLQEDEAVTAEAVVRNRQYTGTKQDILVSGLNIKTVNGGSILGSGNLNFVVPTDLNSYYTKTVTDASAEVIAEALYQINGRLAALEEA